MKPFSTNRAKYHTAMLALLVWLFALASGMANACLLVEPGKHSHGALQHGSSAPHAHAAGAPADHVDAVDDHDGDSVASKKTCLKACDDGSTAQVRLHTGVDLTDPGLAPFFIAFARNAATPVASASGRFDDLQVPILGPPFRLRYPRLTL